MVRWYHAIFSTYGHWLPNDPRGSWSDFIHAYELYRYGGGATTVSGKRSYAHDAHPVAFRREAKMMLKYPPARFDAPCRNVIGLGFARACATFEFKLHACAIGSDHVHLVASRDQRRTIERMVATLKAYATFAMTEYACHPMARFATRSTPTPWGKNGWSVFISDEDQLRCAIRYVNNHPMKEGLPAQSWSFVKPVRALL
jgi:REP element-mobilizing transposase RayT